MDNIQFKFSYLALKLLGKNLYSNAWAALSELVANGLDANANNVYVYIDMRNKRKSTIEVFDDGQGMTYEELRDKYVHIGRNRRADQENADNVMGRKGIGKLAALYLSRHYYVSSKKIDSELITYEMDFSEEKESSNDESPQMILTQFTAFNNKEFLDFSHGTMIRMEDVDLKGYADISVASLNNVLSDFFSLNSLNQKIYLKIVSNDLETNEEFILVEKETPFKNMVEILCFDTETYNRLSREYSQNKFRLPYKKFEHKSYEGQTNIKIEKAKEKSFVPPDSPENSKDAVLKGWIGIHSSINQKIAEKNDDRFKKNKLYNPLKLRIYVRNKLAIDDFLPIINNTQVFVNFVEGEISFDLLDDNDFPDIATTSRQSMDENDGRIIYLAEQMKSVITKLIRSRQKIRRTMSETEDTLNKNSDNEAKRELSKTLDKTIDTFSSDNDYKPFSESPTEYFNEIKATILKNVKGETLKKNYKVFFSHSRKNKKILDFYFYLLRDRGVKDEEMFYTSKDNHPEINLRENLSEISKKSIIDTSTAMFFYSSEDFTKSEYCMFEGGAAWATRTPDDIYVTFDNFKFVPKYLKPGEDFLLEINDQTDILAGDNYNRVIQSLNFLINHINKGRLINLESEVSVFKEVIFPDKVHQGNGAKPNLNKKIIEYWNAYIKDGTLKEAESKATLSD